MKTNITGDKQNSDDKNYHDLILDNIFDLVALYEKTDDFKFRIIKGNRAFFKLINLTEEEAKGKLLEEVLDKELAKRWTENNLDVLTKGKPVINLTEDYGNYGIFDVHLIPIRNTNGQFKHLLATARNISERIKLEKEMSRLNQLNVIGEMAAGISHEIRNPLTTVKGFLQLLLEKESVVEHLDHFKLMIQELDRANSIISEFLSLARDKKLSKEKHNLNCIIESMYPLIAIEALSKDKSIILNLRDIPNLYLDEGEIRQLIINIVRNGLEAMSHGGRLTIHTLQEGDEIVLSIEDNGTGIEPKILDKIGTPFITTKDNGTGLGLAICYSIASRHNAKINIKTSPQGTTFSIVFKILPDSEK